MEHPDKILWDKIKLNSERYEYVPIPTAVWRIIRPKVGEWTLLCHYVHKDEHGRSLDTEDERTLLLHYVKSEWNHIEQKDGYCFTHYIKEEKLKDKILQVAESIAEDWPQFAVKHRAKKPKK